MTVVLVGPVQSGAVASVFAPFAVVDENAAYVAPPPTPSATPNTTISATLRKRLRFIVRPHRLRFQRTPDPPDLVDAEQQRRSDDQQQPAERPVHVEQRVAELGHPVHHEAD